MLPKKNYKKNWIKIIYTKIYKERTSNNQWKIAI